MPRPPPPATALMITGSPRSLRDLERLLLAVDRAVAARQDRHARLLHRAPRPRLVAEQADHVRRGADELDVARLADFGEVGALGQEAVAGMDRVGAGDFGGADDRRHVEVALGAARRADADVLVGEAHVQRVLVGLGIDGDGLDAELAAGTDDPQGDLSAVGDEDFLEHASGGLDGEQAARRTAPACRSPRRRSRSSPSYSDVISFISFIASMMQSTWSFFTRWPISTNDGAPGSGAAVERADDRRLHHRELDRGLVGVAVRAPRRSDRPPVRRGRGAGCGAAGAIAGIVGIGHHAASATRETSATRPPCARGASARPVRARIPRGRAPAPARESVRYQQSPFISAAESG